MRLIKDPKGQIICINDVSFAVSITTVDDYIYKCCPQISQQSGKEKTLAIIQMQKGDPVKGYVFMIQFTSMFAISTLWRNT